MRKTKLFQSTGENVMYLTISLIVLIWRLGFGVLPFIVWLLSAATAVTIGEHLLEAKIAKNRLESSMWAIFFAVWALTALILRWCIAWYFVGIPLYMGSELVYFAVMAFKKGKNFPKLLLKAAKITADKHFGED